MKEFFGIGGYQRTPEGYLSWQHLTFVSVLMLVMIGLAVYLGRKNRLQSDRRKNRVVIVTAILVNVIQVCHVVFLCIREKNAMQWLYLLPLFLCDINLVALPLAAFSGGRIKEASLDFVLLFGILGAVLGTYGAGQNYSVYPVLSYDNVLSGVWHAMVGFASVYIAVSGMASIKNKNIGIHIGILTGFCVAAYLADVLIPYNYMFLMRGDGTPYDILYNLLNGNRVLYPLSVWGLFLVCIALFYGGHSLLTGRKKKQPDTNA